MVERAFPAEGVEEFEPGKVSKGEHMIHVATLTVLEPYFEAAGAPAAARQMVAIRARLVELQGDPL